MIRTSLDRRMRTALTAMLTVATIMAGQTAWAQGDVCPGRGTHVFVEEITPATCTTPGSIKMVCKFCHKKSPASPTTEIPALGHAWEDHEALEATCTAAGHTAYQQCSRCGEKHNYSEIPATHHVSGNLCTVCGKYGYCGTPSQESDVTWELTGDAPNCTLTISGTGAIADYSNDTQPWADSRCTSKTQVIGYLNYFAQARPSGVRRHSKYLSRTLREFSLGTGPT